MLPMDLRTLKESGFSVGFCVSIVQMRNDAR